MGATLILVQILFVITPGVLLNPSYYENPRDSVTNVPDKGDSIDYDENMSESKPLEPGGLIEPVVFEPKPKIWLSQSTYKVSSYIDF